MFTDLKPILEELEEIFGVTAVSKLMSHLNSLNNKLEELEKSRDKWKNKYLELKEKIKKEE